MALRMQKGTEGERRAIREIDTNDEQVSDSGIWYNR